jgi:1,4-alpha-glucan branching enzyme
MSLTKQYLKSKPVCKVTFRVPAEAAGAGGDVHIAGDFNDWDLYAIPLKKLRDGTFKVTLELAPNREYQFRYLIGGNTWENDAEADRYVPSPYGDSENSVVVV